MRIEDPVQCRNLAMKGLFIIALVFLMGSSLSSSRPQRYCDLSGAFMAYPVFRDRPEVSGAEKFQGEHFELYIRDLTINRVLLWQIRMMSFIVQDNHMIRMCIPWESTGRMGLDGPQEMESNSQACCLAQLCLAAV